MNPFHRAQVLANAAARISRRSASRLVLSLTALCGFVMLWLAVAYWGGGPGRDGETRQKPGRQASPAFQAASSGLHEQRMLSRALAKRPGHVPILLRLARLSSDSGDTRKAAEYLSEALRSEPGNADARLEMGKILFETGDVQGAIAQNESILSANPHHADALYNMGAIYGNLGRAGVAMQYWNKLIEAEPQSESAKRATQQMGQLQSALHKTVR